MGGRGLRLDFVGSALVAGWLVSLAGCDPAGAGDAADLAGGKADALDDGELAEPGYATVRQKSAHNSYQRAEAIIDQLVYHRVRSLELDIHVDMTFDDAPDGDWLVYHSDIIDAATQCRLLSDCLGELTAFAQAVPNHEVVTLWIDLKDDWADGKRPADLDAMLETVFGDALFTPADLRDTCPNANELAEGARACGWPATRELRGRVIVALTGGKGKLQQYAEAGKLAFVAPGFTDASKLGTPGPELAIVNTNVEDVAVAAAAVEAGYIVRTWGIEDEAQWEAVADAGVHHLATDFVNAHRDPWASTADAATGWPFACIGDCEPPAAEPGTTVVMEVDTGDIWNDADDFELAYQDRRAAPGGEWTALVSTPNSHVEPFAKGCLMARAGLAPDAAYLAVCRPADEEPVRVQIRSAAGQSTDAIEDDIVPGDTVSPTNVAWLRLVVDPDGLCATGYGAHQYGEWVEIASSCFDEPLTHQGLAASAHDAGPIALHFVDPRRDGTSVEEGDLGRVVIQ